MHERGWSISLALRMLKHLERLLRSILDANRLQETVYSLPIGSPVTIWPKSKTKRHIEWILRTELEAMHRSLQPLQFLGQSLIYRQCTLKIVQLKLHSRTGLLAHFAVAMNSTTSRVLDGARIVKGWSSISTTSTPSVNTRSSCRSGLVAKSRSPTIDEHPILPCWREVSFSYT